ncbi:hypothetical protein KY284_032560 [Solanum tuberosum]|nr:hypothetical protein KY284_032560 [Solanum tuberosum]
MEYFELRRVLLPVTQNRGRIKVGTPEDTMRVSTHAIDRGATIKVGSIIWLKNQGDIGKIGLSRMIMKRTRLT